MNIYIAVLSDKRLDQNPAVKLNDVRLFSSYYNVVDFVREQNRLLSNPHKQWRYKELTLDTDVPKARDIATIIRREECTVEDAITSLYKEKNYIEDAMGYIRKERKEKALLEKWEKE